MKSVPAKKLPKPKKAPKKKPELNYHFQISVARIKGERRDGSVELVFCAADVSEEDAEKLIGLVQGLASAQGIQRSR